MSPARLPDRRQVRRAVPRPLRHLLYDHSPARRRRWRRTPGLERLDGPFAALTFDDGPDAAGTPPVLEMLDELEARATFFVLGEEVRRSPELAREVRDRGHELALHGMTHRRHDGLTLEEARSELGDGLAAIEEALGERPRWYRPPYGGSSPTLATVSEELGLRLAYWTSWGFDWEPLSGEEIARVALRDLGPGTIFLLHDSAAYAERESAAPTAAALPPIVEATRSEGLELRTLSAATADATG
jgi:peptidoglycan/xylan/chitin deacetylase (PgdA/CDA1 family)